MITLQFVLGGGLPSQAIAWFSAGGFSHVDAVKSDNGYLYGARSDKVGLIDPGVQFRPPGYAVWKQRVVMNLSVAAPVEKRFWDFLLSQQHKPYDSSAIWGFASGRDWRTKDSWFCSELQAAALEESGASPDLYTPINKITPAALALVMSALGATCEG